MVGFSSYGLFLRGDVARELYLEHPSFSLNTPFLGNLLRSCDFIFHVFADDTQVKLQLSFVLNMFL